MPLRALLFDFDGLVLDTETAELRSWEELWQEHGQRFPVERFLAEIGTVGGYGASSALEQLVGPLDPERLARRSARKLALVEAEQLLPGVAELLEQARAGGVSTAIVSSSSRRWVEGQLGRLGYADSFDTFVCGDHDRERSKPRPTLYLEALATLGVAAGEAIAFEDSPNGVKAALAAGIFTVAVPNGVTVSLDLAAADVLVSSLSELGFERLEQLLG
jgi:HAD superfamily hydrolase (TIGR01509 family)